MVYWSYDGDGQAMVEDGLLAWVRNAGSVVTHFFTRTRWSRLLHQIR
jgi:hypothetical protein